MINIRQQIILCLSILGMAAQATIIPVGLSPAPGDALNSINYANGDHTLGLSAPNAVGQPASPATGGLIGGGITFDDVTKALSWEIGYGSDFGFVDLTGDFSVAHVHGDVAVQYPAANTGAGVQFGLTNIAGSSARTGSFIGSIALSAAQETSLLANTLYINVHSAFAPGGEIRGQFVPLIPEASSVLLFGFGLGALLLWRRRM